jgi:hypothetical protein
MASTASVVENSTKAVNAKTRKSAKAEAKAQLNPLCLCGCGRHVVTPKARFISGDDAVLKGRLLREFDEGNEASGLRLIELGWFTNDSLEARADKREAKVRAKAREEKAALAKAEKEATKQRKAGATQAGATQVEVTEVEAQAA